MLLMLYTETLNDNKDFLAVYKKGRYAASEFMVIYVRPNNRPFNRFGITAGKKIGCAVCRNRAKRLIRQLYRDFEIMLPVGIDIVFVARKPICNIKYQSLYSYMKNRGTGEINRIAAKSGDNRKK